MVDSGSSTRAGSSTGALYERLVAPLLSRDDGADAEQLSSFTLTALAQASLRRQWPLVSGALAGLAAELQRPDPRLEQTLFGCRFSNPVGLAAG
ncbi:MAG: dihydroorotate dehydrogenase (quinone), partial [Cyanobacteria bacterium]|nr:dihydroorotate dehydrogenase (quinone) [Cyanobacteriota bacterium]